jgi:hypothetical protein
MESAEIVAVQTNALLLLVRGRKSLRRSRSRGHFGAGQPLSDFSVAAAS